MSGFFCALSLLPDVVQRVFKKFMIHPTAYLIKEIDCNTFYLKHNRNNTIETGWPRTIINSSLNPNNDIQFNSYKWITRMWWRKYEIDKYIICGENSLGKLEEELKRMIRKNVCMANSFYVCHCNGNKNLHDIYLNKALQKYLQNYTIKLLHVIENLSKEEIKSLMCDVCKISSTIYLIRYNLNNYHGSNEYYINTIKELQNISEPLNYEYINYSKIYI